MQIHELSPSKKKSIKRVGRGGKKGTYSGKGNKGQRSRSGFSRRATFEGGMSTLVARTKKSRGEGFSRIGEANQVISLDALESHFSNDQEITAEVLKENGLIRKVNMPVKILSDGVLTKKLVIKGLKVSKAAKEKIEAAGGKVEEAQS